MELAFPMAMHDPVRSAQAGMRAYEAALDPTRRHVAAMRSRSLQDSAPELYIWLTMILLFNDAFAPGRAYLPTDPNSDVSRKATRLQCQLLGLAGRSLLPAFDLAAAAYYSEAFALLRSALESWARAVYVRLRPREHHRWYSPEDDQAPDPARFKEPSMGEIEGVVKASKRSDDIERFAEAEVRFKLLTIGAHPSGEAVGQLAHGEKLVFAAQHHPLWLGHAVSHALFAGLALLDEVEQLEVDHESEHSDDWTAALAALRDGAVPYLRAITPVLEATHAAIAAERSAKQASKQAANQEAQETLVRLVRTAYLGTAQ
jgi:hypothetical protein